MKHYEAPIMEIATFKVEDILTTSDLIGGDNELEEDEG